MTDAERRRLAVVGVKTAHTAIFFVELASIAWLLVTGVLGRRDRSVALAAAAVAVEAAVFVANDRVCPLTPLTQRLGADRGPISDIFLPGTVARALPIWSGALLGLAGALHLRSVMRGRRRSGAR